MVTILYTKLTETFSERLFDRYLDELPLFLKEKISTYKSVASKYASLLGFLLLRKGLDDSILDEMYYDKFGKPHLRSNTTNFNISHSNEYVLCAFSDAYKIGIDIEEVRPIEVENFKHHLTQHEWETIIRDTNSSIAFLDYWTQKEAVIKADGRGLQIPLHTFEINNKHTKIDNSDWYIYHLNDFMPNQSAHLALNKKIAQDKIKIRFIDFER